ncbi:hypothetical protein T440DRAFT_466587 [Plenodomus tracheiphilus IPT5]|uniref:F-box domain-containing protein n=1 Tax=Plenodomus tracheiphilus IPT5 TaxID=1408161 RepID=A0A6A7BF53_9PLEO|nr:hypothetical protein T440DRAFT_466587 [Plenodomus tracheiphilus IPT5]
MGPATFSDDLPTSLADLLSNTLILRQTAPYLPVAALCNLSRASKSLHQVVLQSPEAFRYLDLSPVKSAVVPFDGPLDVGGVSFRAERMDEALTEDDFYSGPLRGIFARLEKIHVLRNIHTLILDGLSVTAELVKELITEERYNVRILSIREVKHLNERKLQQYLRYAVRPSRPAGTPRVKGIYMFGPRDPVSSPPPSTTKKPNKSTPRGVMSSQGAQIGAEWNQKSSEALNVALAQTEDRWYRSSGKMILKRPSAEWAEILQACEGIIAFDAVLCRGPRHDPSRVYTREGTASGVPHPASFLRPTIATVALGPSGCETCHSCPEGAAVFGQSTKSQFPLLSPVPLHGSSLRAAQIPHTTDGSSAPPLIARCEDCLKGRWCERCHKWWDEGCYIGSTVAQRTELQQTELTESLQPNGTSHLIPKQTIKVIGVRRDCFGCGHTCISCKELFIRTCKKCKNEYCREDNEASSDIMCDWCNYTSRRTVEMY